MSTADEMRRVKHKHKLNVGQVYYVVNPLNLKNEIVRVTDLTQRGTVGTHLGPYISFSKYLWLKSEKARDHHITRLIEQKAEIAKEAAQALRNTLETRS